MALAREGRVVVVLPWHYPQDGLHRVERAILVRLLRGFDATMKHVAQSIDPRDLQETLQLKIALLEKNARARELTRDWNAYDFVAVMVPVGSRRLRLFWPRHF